MSDAVLITLIIVVGIVAIAIFAGKRDGDDE
jgi:hypothetical protein